MFIFLFQLRSIPNQEFYLISNLSQLVLYKGEYWPGDYKTFYHAQLTC